MQQSEIRQLLPAIFQQAALPGSPLAALLAVMETLHAPDEAILANLEAYFDPYRTPDHLLPFLARWVDLDQLLADQAQPTTAPFPSGNGQLRELVALASYLAQARGTLPGLIHFLQLATGITGFQVDERVLDPAGTPRPFHLRVRAPAAAQRYQPLIAQIVEREKPAYVTYELTFD